MKKIVLLFIVLSISLNLIFSDDSMTITDAVPYSEDEFPQWTRDLRRAEIISLGALPFVTLSTTIAYSFYRYYEHDYDSNYIPNPFAKSSDSANLDTDEQKFIVLTSGLISLGFGLTDFAFNMFSRNSKNKKQQRLISNNNIKITPIDNEKNNNMDDVNRMEAYLYGGMKNVIF